MWIPVVFSFLYTGWILWRRHADEFATQPARSVSDPLAGYGTDVRILQFYTTTHEAVSGEKVLVCYGVVNAVAMRLDPPVEKVWPALSRCFNVAPKSTTRYTLTAEGANHKSVSESLEIPVKP